MKFHHVWVACLDIRVEVENIKKIHTVIDVSDIVFDIEQNAELCMLQTSEGIAIELVSGEQVKNLIKRKITYYHLCFETEDLDAEIERLRNDDAFLVSEPKPAILFGNKKVSFLQVSYGLIELIENRITHNDF